MTEQFSERPSSYIGVSGVTNRNQEWDLSSTFFGHDLTEWEIRRQMAIGVKATHKTQFLDEENKYGPEWYPVGEKAFTEALDPDYIRRMNSSQAIERWFPPDPEIMRIAQVYLDPQYTDDAEYLKKFVDRIIHRGKPWMDAIQFDVDWNSNETILPFIGDLHDETGLPILLQCRGETMQELGPDRIVKRLGHYAQKLTFILFDASHGTGKRMNAYGLKPFLDAAYTSDELAGVGFAVAGGLNTQVVREELPKLLGDYPDLSWDAEGQLHPQQPDGTSPIDSALVSDYFKASSDVITDRVNATGIKFYRYN